MNSPLRLRGPVGDGRDNDLSDVAAVKRAMQTLGRYRPPPYGIDGYFDRPLVQALSGYQKDSGLKVDGWLAPGGETEAGLNRDLAAGAPSSGPGLLAAEARQARGAKAPPVPGRKPTPPRQIRFESPIDSRFREEIHLRESAEKDYKAESEKGTALGRYQFTKKPLQDAGLRNEDGSWTGKWGINSKEDFLSNPDVQERVFVGFIENAERRLEHYGATDFIGQQIDGIEAPFKITLPGLVAAAHRQGEKDVVRYLKHQEKHGWDSDASTFEREDRSIFLAIETRLREFENIPHR